MSLLRMFALRLDESSAGSAPAAGGGGARRPTSTPAMGAAPASGPVASAAAGEAAKPQIMAARAMPPPIASPAPPPRLAQPAVENIVVSTVQPATATKPYAADAPWDQQVEALGLDGMARQLARHCAWIADHGETVRLSLEARAKHLLTEERRAVIERALRARRGDEVRVVVEIGAASGDQLSPAGAEERRVIDRQRGAEAAIEADPVVRTFREAFGATVRPGSVQPIE
jgi:DNA polymerase-3 subunit gamma/tau